jgi:tyrosine aminotransferase
VRLGMTVWGNRFFGPNSMIQAALPELLATSAEWFGTVNDKIRNNAEIIYDGVATVQGLHTNMPGGAMYMLIRVDPGAFDLRDDVEFCTAFYREEAVFVLPGMCFNAPGYMRFVLGTPEHVTRDVVERLQGFCQRHHI